MNERNLTEIEAKALNNALTSSTKKIERPVDRVVMCDAMIRGTSPYSFRAGEWAHIVGVKMSTPHGLATRAVYQCLYYDGVTDYIPVSDTDNYEIGT